MINEFADWLRLAHLEPDHDTVGRRWDGVEKNTEELTENDAIKLVLLFNQMPTSSDFIADFSNKFHEADNSFPMTENDLELSVLSGAVIAHTISENTDVDISNILALSVVCLNLAGHRNRCPVPEIVNRCREHLEKTRAALRGPTAHRIKEIKSITKNTFDEEKIVAACAANPPSELATQLTTIVKAMASSLRTANANDKILKSQLDIFREESDVLWWLTAAYCRDRNVTFENLPWPATSLHLGKDLAALVKKLPGPSAYFGILNRAIEASGNDASMQYPLASTVSKMDKTSRTNWTEETSSSVGLPLCPILNAIHLSSKASKQGDWTPKFKEKFSIAANTKLSAIDLSVQIFHEILLIRSLIEAGE